jgi:hypothetical protein
MKMMRRFAFRPKELKVACETEPWSHKAKIVGFSVLMSSIASYYQYYFDMLIYRSGQFQAAALAGEPGYEFLNYQEGAEWGAKQWTQRQTLDAWKEKGIKELKQISKNWKTDSYSDSGTTVYTNPNGNPKDNQGYYTQDRKFYNDYMDEYNNYWADYYSKSPIDRDADEYSNWADMHKDVMWFDTAACWKGKYIGQVNDVVITPDLGTNPQYETDLRNPPTIPNAATDANAALNGKGEAGAFGQAWAGWYTGANYSNQSPEKDFNNDPAYNKLVAPKDSNGPYQINWELKTVTNSAGQSVSVYQKQSTFRANAWDVDVSVTGSIEWADDSLTTDLN